jgi:protocatechuate 3,4-dioxygenase beta subunit
MNTHRSTQPAPGDNRSSGGISRRRLLHQARALGIAAAAGGSIGAGPGLAAAASAAAFASAASLTLTPEQEEGPFYVALEKIRKNITLGRTGIPLHLTIKLVDATGNAVKGAACDIWQCDALGVYSDESSESTVGQTWLRGVQFTNTNGIAEFVSIYPGHYAGRATHIHVKVHISGTTMNGTYSGGHVSHTGQLLFDDAISTEVYELAPYTSETAARVMNTSDRVYEQQGGSKSMLILTKLGSAVSDGFLGVVRLVVDPTATPAAVGVSTSGSGSPPSGGNAPGGTQAATTTTATTAYGPTPPVIA